MLVLNNQATATDFPGATGGAQLGPSQQGLALELEVYNATATVQIIYRPLLGGVRDFQYSEPFDLLPQIKTFAATPRYAPVGFRAKSATPGTPATIYARVYEKGDAYTLGTASSVTGTVSGGQPVPFSTIARLFDLKLAADSAAITFPSIPQGFTNLMVVSSLRDDRAAVTSAAGIVFNSDTATHYEYLDSSGSASSGLTSIPILNCASDNADPGHRGLTNVICSEYSVVQQDHALVGTGMLIGNIANTATWQTNTRAGQWCIPLPPYAAITRIDVVPLFGATVFRAGSRLTVYGLL